MKNIADQGRINNFGAAPVSGGSRGSVLKNHPTATAHRKFLDLCFMLQREGIKHSLGRYAEKLSSLEQKRKQAFALILDACFIVLALATANILRLSTVDFSQLWPLFLILPIVSVLVFVKMGVYKMVIRFSGMDDLAPLAKSIVVSSFLLLIVQSLLAPEPNPRSIFIIYGLVLFFLCVSARQIWKWLADGTTSDRGAPIAIYGAGALGRQVMHICRNGVDYRPVVWLDDNSKYHGRELSKLRVLDPKDKSTPALLKAKGIETILMAIPHVDGSRMKELLESLQTFDCRIKTLPSIEDIMENRVTTRDAKTLPLEELIGRQPVVPDADLMRKNITGKVVMVTGAGGSVGSELCRQILPLSPKALVLFDISEAAMYQIESDLKNLSAEFKADGDSQQAPSVHCVLGNVVFKSELVHTLSTYSVQTLFHAAAYKHVPMVESNPQPAIRTNIFGSLATVEAAIETGVENFLLISTDKAVRPTNVMGATKRVAEMMVQAKAAAGSGTTKLCMVRFGNVIGSSGSVVPKFSKQIENGGPITVTHKDIVRYFMSIPEAAQLVIQASALCRGGDLFLLDMGQPVQIVDLAKSLVYLHGKTLKDEENPYGSIEIQYTGLREGEKLYEELLIDETAQSTVHPKISRAEEGFLEWHELSPILDRFLSIMQSDPDNEMVDQLKKVVRGYKPNRAPAPKRALEEERPEETLEPID